MHGEKGPIRLSHVGDIVRGHRVHIEHYKKTDLVTIKITKSVAN